MIIIEIDASGLVFVATLRRDHVVRHDRSRRPVANQRRYASGPTGQPNRRMSEIGADKELARKKSGRITCFCCHAAESSATRSIASSPMPDAAITTRRPNISSRSTPLARNQVADAFAVPNLDRNRRHTPIQIQLKRTFFTGDSIALCEPRKSLRASRKDHLPFGEINKRAVSRW